MKKCSGVIKCLALYLLFGLFASQAVQGQLTSTELPNVPLSNRGAKLQLKDSVLFVGTGDGVYRKSLKTPNSGWKACGFQGLEVLDFLVLSTDSILCSIEISEGKYVLLTPDGGASTADVSRNFSTDSEQACFQLARKSNGRDYLGLAGACVVRAKDLESDWQPIYLDWDYFLYQSTILFYHPSNENWIYSGGENGFFSGILNFSQDGGQTWVNQLYLSNNAFNTIYSDTIEPLELIAGMEGRISKSVDGGYNWVDVFMTPNYEYIYAVIRDPEEDHHFFAAGCINGENEYLRIFNSEDRGNNWGLFQELYFPEGNGIRDLIIFKDAFFLLANDGQVYRWEMNPSTVQPEMGTTELGVHNPVKGSIQFQNRHQWMGCRYSLFTSDGKTIKEGIISDDPIGFDRGIGSILLEIIKDERKYRQILVVQ